MYMYVDTLFLEEGLLHVADSLFSTCVCMFHHHIHTSLSHTHTHTHTHIRTLAADFCALLHKSHFEARIARL